MSASTEKNSKFAGIVTAILIVVLGIYAAKLMWLVLTPEKQLGRSTQVATISNRVQKVKINYGKLISNQHIFGEVKRAQIVEATPEKPTKKAPPRTNLNLKLHGIVAYESNNGFVLISSKGGTQNVYSQGEEIKKDSGVFVDKILPEKVVLNNNGTTEELVLPVDQLSNKRSSTNSAPTNYIDRPNDPVNSSPYRRNNKNIPDLAKLRQEAFSNPQKLMQIARPYPAIVNGQFIGYRVQPGSNRRLFRQLGFRPGDIITEVNGIILDDASKGIMLLGELSQASALSVIVQRGSQIINISHDF